MENKKKKKEGNFLQPLYIMYLPRKFEFRGGARKFLSHIHCNYAAASFTRRSHVPSFIMHLTSLACAHGFNGPYFAYHK